MSWTVGQEVLRYTDHHNPYPTRHTIKRITKSVIILSNGEKFWKHNGVRVGDTALWFRCHIEAIRNETNSTPA